VFSQNRFVPPIYYKNIVFCNFKRIFFIDSEGVLYTISADNNIITTFRGTYCLQLVVLVTGSNKFVLALVILLRLFLAYSSSFDLLLARRYLVFVFSLSPDLLSARKYLAFVIYF
jgi:hypothetical protein